MNPQPRLAMALAALSCLAVAQTAKPAAPLVTLTLVARDAQGHLIRDLSPGDITVLEDNKPQTVTAMVWQDLDAPQPLPAALAALPNAGRRLIVMDFDLTTMTPNQEEAAIGSAQAFFTQQMRPADRVAIVALSESLQMVQDFTADKARLAAALRQLGPALGGQFSGGDGSGDGSGGGEMQLTAVDRDLIALQSLCDSLAPMPSKKTLLLYSGGLARAGSSNEVTLRSAVNAAVKGDISIYSVDARLLPVRVAGGGAAAPSRGGAGAYNGQAQTAQLTAQQRQQDSLSTLATDTGGRALLNSADDLTLYRQAEDDTQSGYLIAYVSTNPKRDGKFRRITVKLDRPGVHLLFTPGYIAAKSH